MDAPDSTPVEPGFAPARLLRVRASGAASRLRGANPGSTPPTPGPGAAGGEPRRSWPWLLPPFLLGVVLRLWNLPAQVLGDDEFHAVRAALGRPVAEILVTYQRVDNSIPLSALFRFLMDRGVALSEAAFRLPSLLAGLLVLALFPALAVRRLGRGTAVAFAWLLALSPGLVWYSRIARSYLPMVLLGGLAAFAFAAWWERPTWRRGLAYVVLAALATWFHLGAATFVVSPFLYAAAAVVRRRDGRRALAVAALAATTLLAFLCFLVPARRSLLELVRDKHGSPALGAATAGAVLELQAGSAVVPVTVLFWITAAAGLVLLARRDRFLAGYTAALVLGHLAGLLALAPAGHEFPLVFNRYLLPALPVVLLWVAVALGGPWPARVAVPVRVALAGLVLLILFAAGPLVEPALRRSPFAHHDDFLAFYARRAPPPADLPRFYRQLARTPGDGVVLEYPWLPVWRVNRAFYLYQEVHGRDVVVSPARALLWDPRLALRNLAAGEPEGFLASRARYLVIHRDLGVEEDRIPDPYWPPRPGPLPQFRLLFAHFGHATGRLLKRRWGDPDYADEYVQVWDLDRVRRTAGAAGR
jgi:hypothetical protein